MANISPEVIKLAQQTEAKYGVPASVTIAQYGVESGWGSSGLSSKANNYFGITGKNVNTGKFVMMDGRSWAAYNSMAESFHDHGRLLSTDLYSNAHKNTTNAFQYVDAISEIYAPSSDGNNGYAALVKQVIIDNDLTQYDQAGASSSTYSAGSSTGYYIPSTGEEEYFVPSDGVMFISDSPSTWEIILGKIVKFLALVIVGVLAAVFFFNAFPGTKPHLNIKKSKKKEGANNGGQSE